MISTVMIKSGTILWYIEKNTINATTGMISKLLKLVELNNSLLPCYLKSFIRPRNPEVTISWPNYYLFFPNHDHINHLPFLFICSHVLTHSVAT